MKRIILLITCLLIAAIAIFVGTSSNKFQKEVAVEVSAVKLAREVARGDYQLVTATELKLWQDQSKPMVLVDAMPLESSYNKAHLPQAEQFLFPIKDMNNWDISQTANRSMQDYQAMLGDDKDKAIVVYCGFVKCTRSHNAAIWAKKLGYNNVYRFAGGIYAWKGAGYTIEAE